MFRFFGLEPKVEPKDFASWLTDEDRGSGMSSKFGGFFHVFAASR